MATLFKFDNSYIRADCINAIGREKNKLLLVTSHNVNCYLTFKDEETAEKAVECLVSCMTDPTQYVYDMRAALDYISAE